MKIIRTKADLRALTESWRRAGETIGVVPTMGALHAGHLSLVERACAENDRVIVTLFVNPKQFGPGEDLDSYPRDAADDMAKLEAEGADLLFHPGPEEVYPTGFATSVHVDGRGRRRAHRGRAFD